MPLLESTTKGIYCPIAGVYIDPWYPVDKALITHGHSDHARRGNGHYVCTHGALPVMRYRLGDIQSQGIAYGEALRVNGVRFSFHPAGHVPGSAQIRVEYRGEIWVASGDYKTEADGFSEPFEPIRCHNFITESTFGLPVYRWAAQQLVVDDIHQWWQNNRLQGKTSVLVAYALGKAQRILAQLDPTIGPLLTHGAVGAINEILEAQGYQLPKTHRVTHETDKKMWAGALIIVPPSALNTPWMNRFKPFSLGIASGWMSLRGARRRRAADRGFVLSDHADWVGLNAAIKATGASHVYVTHGYTDIFAQWLRECGLYASTLETRFTGESLDQAETPDFGTENTEETPL
jgi:putative mRNA 3-end processing factor